MSHQIGPVLAKDGALYVSVGDAEVPESAQSLKSPNGKILRMTYDGKAMPDNPFYSSAHPDAPQSYIWAYGIRNAFGLAFAGDRLFAADNGPGITESAAKRLADWLLKEEDQPVAGQTAPSWIWRIKILVGYPFGMRALGIAFIDGMAVVIIWRRVFRRR